MVAKIAGSVILRGRFLNIEIYLTLKDRGIVYNFLKMRYFFAG
jgi:hypothetical protein